MLNINKPIVPLSEKVVILQKINEEKEEKKENLLNAKKKKKQEKLGKKMKKEDIKYQKRFDRNVTRIIIKQAKAGFKEITLKAESLVYIHWLFFKWNYVRVTKIRVENFCEENNFQFKYLEDKHIDNSFVIYYLP